MKIKYVLLIAGIACIPKVFCAAEGVCARTSIVRRKPPITRILKPHTDLSSWTDNDLLQKTVICHLGTDGHSILAFHQAYTSVTKTGYTRAQDHFGFALIPQSSAPTQGLYVDKVCFMNRNYNTPFFALEPNQEVRTDTLVTTIAAYLNGKRFFSSLSS